MATQSPSLLFAAQYTGHWSHGVTSVLINSILFKVKFHPKWKLSSSVTLATPRGLNSYISIAGCCNGQLSLSAPRGHARPTLAVSLSPVASLVTGTSQVPQTLACCRMNGLPLICIPRKANRKGMFWYWPSRFPKIFLIHKVSFSLILTSFNAPFLEHRKCQEVPHCSCLGLSFLTFWWVSLRRFMLGHPEREGKKPVTKGKRNVILPTAHSPDPQAGILASLKLSFVYQRKMHSYPTAFNF